MNIILFTLTVLLRMISLFSLRIFLPQLEKYENDPEEVGCCFVFSVETLNNLYTEYCVNKEQNNYLIGLPEAIEFFSVSVESGFRRMI